jgi:hypothetical protein
LVVLPFGTSAHRPDWAPTSWTFCWPVPPDVAYPTELMLAWTAAAYLILAAAEHQRT